VRPMHLIVLLVFAGMMYADPIPPGVVVGSQAERFSRSGLLLAEVGTGRAVLSPRPFPRLRRCSFAALRIVFP
jgi:hypothetical protein